MIVIYKMSSFGSMFSFLGTKKSTKKSTKRRTKRSAKKSKKVTRRRRGNKLKGG